MWTFIAKVWQPGPGCCSAIGGETGHVTNQEPGCLVVLALVVTVALSIFSHKQETGWYFTKSDKRHWQKVLSPKKTQQRRVFSQVQILNIREATQPLVSVWIIALILMNSFNALNCGSAPTYYRHSLADLCKARGCSTNSIAINLLIKWHLSSLFFTML